MSLFDVSHKSSVLARSLPRGKQRKTSLDVLPRDKNFLYICNSIRKDPTHESILKPIQEIVKKPRKVKIRPYA
jgi:hypothetical protein